MASGRIVLPRSVTVGYRFHPTDEEIVSHFLKNKMLGNDHLVHPIPEVDVCKYEPWELPNFSMVDSDDPEWFFFSTRDLKYCQGRRANRATRAGFWKATGKDRKIKARVTKNLIGTKKTLVFHKGRVPNGVRTNWVMHEYHSVDNYHQRTGYVVCLLKKKDDEKVDKSANEEWNNDNVDSDLPSQTLESAVPVVWQEENGGLPPTHIDSLCPNARPNLEDEIGINAFVDSLIVDEDEIDTDAFVDSLIVDEPSFIFNGSSVNCLTLVREQCYDEETADSFDNLFIQPQWTGSTHLEGATFSRTSDHEAYSSLFGDLPPHSNAISECSSWSVQPPMQMMRQSRRRSTLQSKRIHYEKQDNIYRCNEFSGPDISGESTDNIQRRNRILETSVPLTIPKTEYEERRINPVSDGKAAPRIRLQRKIRNAAVNQIKAVEASQYTANDGREENEIRTRPPSEYFANVVVGIILFVVFCREMVLYGEWGM